MAEWVFLIIILIFSAVVHEVSHGAMANRLGDPTAKHMGRLTLNPLKHLDFVGSFILPALMLLLTQGQGPVFGWAKPVPVNPFNFRDQKYGSAKVALAGPGANFAIALFFGLTLRFFPPIAAISGIDLIFSYIVYINLLLAIFNLLPIPPLDGSHILFTFLPQGLERLKIVLNQFGLFILLFVIFFLFNWVALVVNLIFKLIVGVPLF